MKERAFWAGFSSTRKELAKNGLKFFLETPRRRTAGLMLFTILGFNLAFWVHEPLMKWLKWGEVIYPHMRGLFLGLPVFYLLWYFRTYDTDRNINNSSFFGALGLLKDQETKRQAIIQLMHLKNVKKVFKEEIDKSTHGLDLRKVDLSEIDDLQGINLRGANLEEAILMSSNLKMANLQSTKLKQTNFMMAKLQGADLTNSIFSKNIVPNEDNTWANTHHGIVSEFMGAKYDKNTKFPKGFNPKAHGMKEDNSLSDVLKKPPE